MMYLKFLCNKTKFSVAIRQLIPDKDLASNFKSREAWPLFQELCIYCTITALITSHLCTEPIHTASHQEL